MTFVAVLPALTAERTAACLATVGFCDYLIVVDNGGGRRLPCEPLQRVGDGTNVGVAASWNVAVRFALDHHVDYVVLLSSAVRFGAAGGWDWLAHLGESPYGLESTFGWHLIALGRPVFEACGLFDEGFWPAYFEDTDMLYRMHLAGLPSPRENGQPIGPRWACDAADEGFGLHVPLVAPDWAALSSRYVAKWGGAQGDERFKTPYGDPGSSIRCCRPD